LKKKENNNNRKYDQKCGDLRIVNKVRGAVQSVKGVASFAPLGKHRPLFEWMSKRQHGRILGYLWLIGRPRDGAV
jgi:hypothetical protein